SELGGRRRAQNRRSLSLLTNLRRRGRQTVQFHSWLLRPNCIRARFYLAAVLISLLLPARSTESQTSGRPAPSGLQAEPVRKYVPGELLVRFRSGTSPDARRATHASLGTKAVWSSSAIGGLERVKIQSGLSVHQA